jgi:hypothetical protein
MVSTRSGNAGDAGGNQRVRGGAGTRRGPQTMGTRRVAVSTIDETLAEDVVSDEKSTRKRRMENSSEEVKKVKRQALEVAPTTRRSARIQQIVQAQLSTSEKNTGTSATIGRRTPNLLPPHREIPQPASMEDLANTMSTMTLNKNDYSLLHFVVNDWRLEIPVDGQNYPVYTDTPEATIEAPIVDQEPGLGEKTSRQATPESVSSEESLLMLLASAASQTERPPVSQEQMDVSSYEPPNLKHLNIHEIIPNLFLGSFSISLLV